MGICFYHKFWRKLFLIYLEEMDAQEGQVVAGRQAV